MEFKNIHEIKNAIDDISLTNKEIATKQLHEIISLLPNPIKNLIIEAFECKRIPKEYLLSSIIFAFSNAAGIPFSINSLGYTNYGNLYFAIVGSRGDNKSPGMDIATDPLHNFDLTNFKTNEQAKIDDPNSDVPRKQLFLQDATIESAQFVHYRNPSSIGIFVDELYFMVEKMANKNSTEGSAWRTFFLQGSTNKHIDISRKTSKSFMIPKSYPTLMGSIQNQFVSKLFANGNLESGFIDRILFTNKLTYNPLLSKKNMSPTILQNYENSLLNLLNTRIEIENTPEIDTIPLKLNEEAEERMFVYTQNLINRQERLTDYTREYIAKMQINIHKLTLLFHLIENASTGYFNKPITIETLELAILTNEFYLINFKIILEENVSSKESLPTTEGIIKVAIKNNAPQKHVAIITGLHKSNISRKWNEIINNSQPSTKTKNDENTNKIST